MTQTNDYATHSAARSAEMGPLEVLQKSLRVKQWTKNVLVLAAPAAAGILHKPDIALRAALIGVAFCLASSGVYLINDLKDAEADAFHPQKRHRPVASGALSKSWAFVFGLLFIGGALGISLGLSTFSGFAIVGLFIIITTAYTLWLKTVPTLELGIVASGFLLRAIAGGAATGISISGWFLIVASFGSLFVVIGKRHAELRASGLDNWQPRTVLRHYTSKVLRYMLTASSAIAVGAYTLWALDRQTAPGNEVFVQLSTIPFIFAMFKYYMLVDAGAGDEPEELLLHDRSLQLAAAVWIVLMLFGVYAR